MDKQIIKVLFYDYLQNDETIKSETYQNYQKALNEFDELLDNAIGDICKSKDIDLFQITSDISCISEETGFIYGFIYAVRLFIECKLTVSNIEKENEK